MDRTIIWRTMADPGLAWPKANPYAVVGRDAVDLLGPSSSAKDVKDASFDLMTDGGMSTEERAAWDTLRRPEDRLILDFLHYRIGYGPQFFESIRGLPMPKRRPDHELFTEVGVRWTDLIPDEPVRPRSTGDPVPVDTPDVPRKLMFASLGMVLARGGRDG